MIRKANKEDLEEVNKLLSEFNYEVKNLKSNDFLNVLIYVDKTILGVLVYNYIYDRIEIEYIVTKKDKRRCGIATKLLKYLDKYNCSITLEVNEVNTKAINLYKKNGFKEVTKRKNYYKENDAILMMKSGE